MRRNRAPNLSAENIETIVSLIDAWTGELTWERLIAAIASTFGATYTRHGLSHHAPVARAFRLKKNALRTSTVRKRDWSSTWSTELQTALARIKKLEAETARLEAENGRLLAQFVVWLYNADARGLSEEHLNAPLPTQLGHESRISTVDKGA